MEKKVQLSGKCTLQIDTMRSNTKIEIPKLDRDGQNNADSLIETVIHFGVMRHGKAALRQLIEDKLSNYGDEYQSKGLTYE
ncbi:hypothetical protein [Pantoea septica]|uniref:hypothetical protein n=1 Tax=Pantoea septica TaxID=472695 RepID=UPI003D080887